MLRRPIETTPLIGRYFKFSRLRSMRVFRLLLLLLLFFPFRRDPLRLLEDLFQLRHRCHFRTL